MECMFLDSPLDGNEPDWYEKNLKVHSVVRLLNSNSSYKTQNTLCTLRSRSSNIIHHPEGRSELRGVFPCEIDFLQIFRGSELN